MYIPQEIAENYLSACRTKAALPDADEWAKVDDKRAELKR